MLTRPLLALALSTSLALAATPQGEGFTRLTGSQIRRAFTGKQFSDGIHFSYRYAADGSVQGTRMGKKIADKWAVANDKLCVTDSFGESCYTVWIKGASVKLTVDGSEFLLEGSLK